MFVHFDLFIPTPSFSDNIVQDIIKLEALRGRSITSRVHPLLFSQLSKVFHIIESLASARIEGNHTTVVDYVEDQLENRTTSETHKEINTIDQCMKYIDRCFLNDPNTEITEDFIKALHRFLVKDLDPQKEGCRTPGVYRTTNVTITRSQHTPPLPIKINDYMYELLNCINTDTGLQRELLKVAVIHHRFTWIHPFENGNGRMSRVLTYLMLKKYGFDKVALLNPAAVFCIDRNKYFDALSKADTGTEEGMLFWCRYVLSGLLTEFQKIEKLLDREFLFKKIIEPAIRYSLSRQLITEEESKVILLGLSKPDFLIMSKDIYEISEKKEPRQITYLISKMLQKQLLKKNGPAERKYYVNIVNNNILRGFVESLSNEGFFNFEQKSEGINS